MTETLSWAELHRLLLLLAEDPDRHRLCPDCSTNCWPLCGIPGCVRFRMILEYLIVAVGRFVKESRLGEELESFEQTLLDRGVVRD